MKSEQVNGSFPFESIGTTVERLKELVPARPVSYFTQSKRQEKRREDRNWHEGHENDDEVLQMMKLKKLLLSQLLHRILQYQPRRDLHSQQFLKQQFRSIWNHNLANFPRTLTIDTKAIVSHESTFLTDIDLECVRGDH